MIQKISLQFTNVISADNVAQTLTTAVQKRITPIFLTNIGSFKLVVRKSRE